MHPFYSPSVEEVADGSGLEDRISSSPLRRLVRLSRPGSSPPLHTIPVPLSPSWDEIRPFGRASEAIIEQHGLWREYLMLPNIRGLFKESEHERWYALLLAEIGCIETAEVAGELTRAMHADCGLEFDSSCCTRP